jgi:hypothetical protein
VSGAFSDDDTDVVYNPTLPEAWGGWFTSLAVEYLDENGAWRRVEDLAITPAPHFDDSQWLKGSWIDCALSFDAVETTGSGSSSTPGHRAGRTRR